MEIALHNQQMKVPYDAQVEWIWGKHEPYFFTHSVSFTKFTLEVMLHQNSDRQIFGCNGTTNAWFGVRTYGGLWRHSDTYMCIASNGQVVPAPLDLRMKITTPNELNNMKWQINDWTYDFTGTHVRKTSTIGIFQLNSSEHSYVGNAKFYSAQVFDGESLVLDLVPVRKGNLPFIYDKVSGDMYPNLGGNNYELGPDI